MGIEKDRDRKSWRRKLCFTLAYCGLVLPWIVEFVLGWVLVDSSPFLFLPDHVAHRRTVAHSDAGPVEWTTNADGFHDRDHPRRKRAGERRVVCIGDSFFDGPQERPMPERLRELLRARDPSLEVLNVSRSGIDPWHYYWLLRDYVLDREPDLVVVGIYEGNDFVAMHEHDVAATTERRGWFRRPPLRSWFGSLFPRITLLTQDLPSGALRTRWQSSPDSVEWAPHFPAPKDIVELSKYIQLYVEAPLSEVATFLESRLSHHHRASLTDGPDRFDLFAYGVATGMGAPLRAQLRTGRVAELEDPATLVRQVEVVAEFLEAMRALSAEVEVPLLVVLIPAPWVDPDAFDLYRAVGGDRAPLFERSREQREQLAERLRSSDFASIDLGEELAGKSATYLPLDAHWTEAGAQRVAEIVAPRVLDLLRVP